MLSTRRPRHRTEGDRRVERPECRRANRCRADAAHAGDDADRVDVAELALIGRHAVGGVALGMLDMAETFAQCEAHILGMDIVLEVDESLVPGAGHVPGGSEGRIVLALNLGQVMALNTEAQALYDGGSLRRTVGEATSDAVDTAGSSGHH